MDKATLEKLRFPIGKYNPGDDYGMDEVTEWISDIKDLPTQLAAILEDINESDLSKTYRPGSWTVNQVVHHMADSHMNAYVRMKRTLTEEVPTIFPYDEKEWAELSDVANIPIAVSQNILQGVHARLSDAISDLSMSQLAREFQHEAMDGPRTLAWLIGMYSWHGRHHIGHLKLALGK